VTTLVAATETEGRRYPFAGIRRLIADKMTRSLQESAQLSFHAEADITRLIERRRDLAVRGRKISLEDYVIASFARTLADHRMFNATIEDGHVTEHEAIDLAIAVASPIGLVTPVLRGADRLDVDTIAALRSDLVARAASGQIKVAEMKGATATLSNLGRSRVRFFTPILNHPQTSILGVGAVGESPVLDAHGQLAVRRSLGLSLTVDHRLIDGAPAARFLDEFCDRLEGFAHETD